MEDLFFNLSEQEFSKGRKTLLWVFGTIFILIGLWDLYLKIFKHNSYANIGLTVSTLTIGGVVYFIAILATAKKKENYFKVDTGRISYRFGLISPVHRDILWENIDTIYMPSHQKNIFVGDKSGKMIHINLTWIEKNKSRLIKKHIYYVAKDKNIEIIKQAPKKK